MWGLMADGKLEQSGRSRTGPRRDKKASFCIYVCVLNFLFCFIFFSKAEDEGVLIPRELLVKYWFTANDVRKVCNWSEMVFKSQTFG